MGDSAIDSTPRKKRRSSAVRNLNKFDSYLNADADAETDTEIEKPSTDAEEMEIDDSPAGPRPSSKPHPKSSQKVDKVDKHIKKTGEVGKLMADHQFKFFEGLPRPSGQEESSRATRRLSAAHLGLNSKYQDQAQSAAYDDKNKSNSKSRRSKRSFSKGRPNYAEAEPKGKKRISKILKSSSESDESSETPSRTRRKGLVKNRGKDKENVGKKFSSRSFKRTMDSEAEESSEESKRPIRATRSTPSTSRTGGGNRRKGRGMYEEIDLVSSSSSAVETPKGSDSDENSSSNRGSSSSDESESESEDKSSNCQTPTRSLRKMVNLSSMTPRQLSILNQSSQGTPKSVRTPQQMDIDVSEIPRTPNSASYFSASKRILFRKMTTKAKEKKVNESKKNPKKHWRKMKETENDKRPEQLDKKISITKDTAKIMQNYDGQSYHDDHIEESNNLQQQLKNQFPKWVFLMRERFNILLYGYGSKISILTELHSYLKDEFTIMTVNGLMHNDSKVSAKKFVSEFYNYLEVRNLPKLNFTETNVTRNTDELYNFLKDIKNLDDVFVLITNFDELAFAQPNFVNCLSSLARLKSFHIVASSDHINAFMGVNFNHLTNLNFQWIDATTFIPYDIELTYKPQVFGEKDLLNNAKNIFEHVLKSLTQNSKKAFKLLAQLQLENVQLRNNQQTKSSTKDTELFGEGKTPTKIKISTSSKNKAAKAKGILYRDLLRKCRESFIAHSDNALKSLLQEFFDHKLIHYEDKTKSDEKRITIDLDIEILEEFISSSN